MAFISMTLFCRTDLHKNTVDDGGIFMGAMFFAVVIIMFNGFSELAMTIMKLPVFFKQRDLLFYPAWAYSLPTWILKIPISFVEVAVWVIMTYYVIGFDPNFERFLKQYLLLLLLNQMASGLFRFMGALGRNIIVANTFGSFALVAVLVLGGFVLSRDNVMKWWVWGYWASPMMYGQNAIAVNEFLGNSWSHVPPNSTESLGIMVLKSRGVFLEPYWYWLGVGATIGYIFLFNFFYTLALKFLNPFGKPQAVLSKEALAEKLADKAGDSVELSSRGKNSSDSRNESRRSVSSRTLSARVGSIAEVNGNKKRGMVLPFEPLWITFDEIKYAVDMPQEMKTQGVTEDRLQLLKGVTGAFRPGVLTALMGISGAGKTTLMDVLAGRKMGGYIEGNITISGYPKKQEAFARISGYCEQTDIHSPYVTVYESLVYSASLRLPPEVDSTTRKVNEGTMSNPGSGRNSFDMWRNTSMEVFSMSSRHEEDDEESLTWAAIERLPTYLRTRRGLLAEEEGKAREIDVTNLGLLERKNLLERLIKIAEEDNEKFLLKLKDRMNRREKAANIKPDPDLDVYMKAAALEGQETNVVTDYIIKMANGLFRLIAAIGRSPIVANTFGSAALLVVFVLGGFILSRDSMKKWLLWGYWLSPMAYGMNALAVNEFLGKSWRHVPANSTEPLGVLVMKSRGVLPEARWYWLGVVALLGFILLFNFLFTLALQYLDRKCSNNHTKFPVAIDKPQAVMSKEALAKKLAKKTGDTTELSLTRNESQENMSANLTRKRGMVLPFEPLSITFNEIRYAVDMPQEMKAEGITENRLELLKGVSGAFRPGVLTALMGVSGAGKTTLMDVLAGRKTGGYIEGNITISGYPKNQETFARISGYCEQTDIHSPHVTVYEALIYSAWLRLPPEVDSPTRKDSSLPSQSK
ncbi:hypothetical protein DVH24_012179 [Malus domestica]|uniref:ABC transporter domain-containing protein n=1 Tax=Malus domestica TaxID=3750 RepID=A0A498HSF9_MALDO|nr:hypothetical protein DVH24_012179 [Malus domestica]